MTNTAACNDRNCLVCAKQHNLEWNDKDCKWQIKEHKMTREEALKIISAAYPYEAEGMLDAFIDLAKRFGMEFKIEEKKEVVTCISFNMKQFITDPLQQKDLGEVKIEIWPEGLVLWIGGEIKWKSWENKAELNDEVMIIQENGMTARGRLIKTNS